MAFTPISNTVPQYEENGIAASGYYIKFYESGTTTPTAMATDSTGTTLLDKCQLNTEGYPINGSSAVFIPHIDKKYKIALFRNAADADANDLASAAWPAVDGLFPVLSEGNGQVDTVANLRLLKPSFDGQQVELLGHTLAGIGGGGFYYDASDTTSVDNNGTVIVTAGGARWKRQYIDFVTPQMFGCSLGSDDAIAFRAWLVSGHILHGSGQVLLQSLIDIQDESINLSSCDSSFMIVDDYTSPSGQMENLINIRNNPSATESVSSITKDVTLAGDTTVLVSNSSRLNFTGSHPFEVGDVIKVFSDDTIPNAPVNQRQSEMGIVVEKAAGSITLNTSLFFEYATNIRCVSLNRSNTCTLNLRSKTLRPNNNDIRHVFNIAGYVSPVINAECESARGKHIYSLSNYGASGTIQPHNLTDNSSNDQFGYGVADYGSAYSTWDIVGARDFRHAYTTGAPEHSEGFADALEYGGATHCTVSTLTATMGRKATADTHPDSLNTTFNSLSIHQPIRGGGVQLRGKNDVVNNISFSGCGRVVVCSAETMKATVKNLTADITGGGVFYGATGNSDLEVTLENAAITTHNDKEPLLQVLVGNTLNIGTLKVTYASDYRDVQGFSSEVVNNNGGVFNAELMDIDLTKLSGTPAYVSQILRNGSTASSTIIDHMKIRFGANSLNWIPRLIVNNTSTTNFTEIRKLELIPDSGVSISAFDLSFSDLVSDMVIFGGDNLKIVTFQSFSGTTDLWLSEDGDNKYVNGSDDILALIDRTSTGSNILTIMPPARQGQKATIKNVGAGDMVFDAAVFGSAVTILSGNKIDIYADSVTTWKVL